MGLVRFEFHICFLHVLVRFGSSKNVGSSSVRAVRVRFDSHFCTSPILRVGPAREAGVSAGTRRERMLPHKRKKNKKERKKE